MKQRSEAEWRNWIATLQRREPKMRIYGNFYFDLNASAPNWMSIISSPAFLRWGIEKDAQTDSCMFDMMHALWDDPVWHVEQFATFLRIFERETEAGAASRPHIENSINILFGNDPKAGQRPQRYLLSGRYEVLRKLGSGGNGDVFLAWSRETLLLYGLKVMKKNLRDNRAAVSRFKSEIEAWVTLGTHPNIVRAFFLDVVNDTLYMTMEYVEGDRTGGPSLIEKIQKGRLDNNKVSAWFAQVADGLHHAYSSGIAAHRDIKPGNILIARDGTAKISDFGLVAPLRDLDAGDDGAISDGTHTAPGSLLGTPVYMAPEQFDDARTCDQRSDIYSLGVTLYQTVSGGRVPFLPSSPRNSGTHEMLRYVHELRSLHENEPPPRLRSPFWPVIEKCLAKQPEDRFDDICEFREALESVANTNKFAIPSKAEPEDDFWAYRDKGNTLMRLEKYEEGIAAFDAFLARIPDGSALFNKAVCLENLGRFKEALEIYKSSMKWDDYKAYVNGANCVNRMGDPETAMKLAHRATMLEPKDPVCWIVLGNLKFGRGLLDDAIAAYQRAVSLAPLEPTPHYNLALARKKSGDLNGAARSLTRFLRVCSALDDRRSFANEMLAAIGRDKGAVPG